jgi:hypothetical protein
VRRGVWLRGLGVWIVCVWLIEGEVIASECIGKRFIWLCPIRNAFE